MAYYSLSTYYLCRKAVRFAVFVILTFVIPLTTVGCIQFGSSGWSVSAPSPSGKLTASVFTDSVDIILPAPEGITLSESARFRLRRSDGSILKTINLEGVCGVGPPSSWQLLWSSDEKYVACEALGTFWIIDVLAEKKHRIEGEGITSMRWKDESTLVYVENHSKQRGDLSKQNVYALSLPSHEITPLLEIESKIPFHSFHFNQLSPNSERLIYFKRGTLGIASIKKGRFLGEYSVKNYPTDLWWTSNGENCLISTGYKRGMWLYDEKSNSITDITTQFKIMTNSGNGAIGPPHKGSVSGADGLWYLVSGNGTRINADGTKMQFANKDWIYFTENESVVCIQDEIGYDFRHPNLSPTEDFLTLWKSSIDSDSSDGLYGCSIKIDPHSKQVTFGQPKKIKSGSYSESIFWSPDGEKLFINTNKGLISITKEQMQ